MRIEIEHTTVYRYSGVTRHTAQYVRLTPHSNPSQRIEDWRINSPGQMTPWRDAFGNRCQTLVVERPDGDIPLSARGIVETTDTGGVVPHYDAGPPVNAFLRPTRLTRVDAAINEFAHSFRERMTADRIEGLHALMGALRECVAYRRGETDAMSTAAESFAAGAGVCQDHSHLFIACCRVLDVPARYVSGYLCDEGARELTHAASHAWAAAWINHLGWVSFDVSNGICGTERHVGVAIGLDYGDAAPVRGVRHGVPGHEELRVQVRVAAARDQ